MPVNTIAPTAPAQPAPSSTAPASAPTGDFAAALDTATARFDPARLPTVSLGTMVSAMAGADPQRTAEVVASATVGGPTAVAPSAAASVPADGSAGAKILAAGERYLGVPYKWGGTNPATGLDCSGFVQQTFSDLGVKLPRVSVDQSKAGQPVASLAEARPGDLVFWRGDGSRPNHIGIYAGDNKMLVAPSTGDVVKYQEMSRTPHEIRRII